jgi:hypothetical protein
MALAAFHALGVGATVPLGVVKPLIAVVPFLWGRSTTIKRWQTDLSSKICLWTFGTSTRIKGRGFLDLVEIILVTLIAAAMVGEF